VTDDELLAAALGTPDAEPEAAPAGERRRRHGGRATGERSRLPQQRPFHEPRFPYRPPEVGSADELESIHDASVIRCRPRL
jgi:trimethylamine:corrinoid methyltransferase-like protein